MCIERERYIYIYRDKSVYTDYGRTHEEPVEARRLAWEPGFPFACGRFPCDAFYGGTVRDGAEMSQREPIPGSATQPLKAVMSYVN